MRWRIGNEYYEAPDYVSALETALEIVGCEDIPIEVDEAGNDL